MQAPTQNKSSQIKILHLREFPLHIPIFIPLYLLIFWWFYFNFRFIFFYKEQLAKSRGFSERVVRSFLSPYLAVLCRLRELNPSSSIPPFPWGWISLSPHTCTELSKGAVGWLAGE